MGVLRNQLDAKDMQKLAVAWVCTVQNVSCEAIAGILYLRAYVIRTANI
jgi:hypothetical protein